MQTKLIVWIVGLLGLVAGFLLSDKLGDGPEYLTVLCGMIALIFVSAAVVDFCKSGKHAVHSCYLFLVACTSLIGFVLR